MAGDLNISMVLRLVDRATGPIRGVTRQVEALGKAVRKADMGRLADRAGGLRDAQRGAALEAAGLGVALYTALKPAMQFESAMGDVARVVDFKEADGIKKLGRDLQQLATREIPLTARELAAIAAAAGQANVVDKMLPDAEKRAALAAFVKDAARMGVAFEMTAGDAGDRMAGLRNIFSLSQAEVVKLADATNHLGNNMALASRDLVEVMQRAGGTSKIFGLLPEQTAALGSAFLALKVPPEVAASSITAMLVRLQNAPTLGKDAQTAFRRLGISAEQMGAAVKEDAQGALVGFLKLVKASDDPLAVLSAIFGSEQGANVAMLVSGLDQYTTALEHVGDESRYAGSMSEEFRRKMQLSEARTQLFWNALDRLAVSVGEVLIPALVQLLDQVQPMVDAMTDWAAENPELVKTIGLVVAGLIAFKLAAAVGLWLFGSLAGGTLRLAAGAARLAPILSGPLAAAFKIVGRAALMLFANPIGIAVLAVAAAAYLIYRNWDDIRPYFEKLWAALKTIFGGAAQVLQGIVDADFAAVVDGLKSLFAGWFDFIDAWFMGLPSRIASALSAVTDALPGFLFSDDGPRERSGAGGRQRRQRRAARQARAGGGPVWPGEPFIVGEEGPEEVTFGSRGTVTPNHELGRGGPAAAPGLGAVSITINAAPGMDPMAVARAVRSELARLMDGGGDLHDGAMRSGVA